MTDEGYRAPRCQCGHRRCRRPATQAWDVGSWFKARDAQTLTHYEVCDRHADYFTGSFDRQASERVRKDLVPWLEPLR